jgi:hypothetical protein
VSESDAAGAVLSTHDRPVIVLGRHAGEGDTLLVLFELLCPHRRGPRIVLHERLRLDPVIDLLGGACPTASSTLAAGTSRATSLRSPRA